MHPLTHVARSTLTCALTMAPQMPDPASHSRSSADIHVYLLVSPGISRYPAISRHIPPRIPRKEPSTPGIRPPPPPPPPQPQQPGRGGGGRRGRRGGRPRLLQRGERLLHRKRGGLAQGHRRGGQGRHQGAAPTLQVGRAGRRDRLRRADRAACRLLVRRGRRPRSARRALPDRRVRRQRERARPVGLHLPAGCGALRAQGLDGLPAQEGRSQRNRRIRRHLQRRRIR
mmetsp:Transcript_38854/g.122483  ORF Transcript_38854/g.122483 Transcript_38854/m.122483 type:complete len:228 (+) Transcript_38854:72-755(+)